MKNTISSHCKNKIMSSYPWDNIDLDFGLVENDEAHLKLETQNTKQEIHLSELTEENFKDPKLKELLKTLSNNLSELYTVPKESLTENEIPIRETLIKFWENKVICYEARKTIILDNLLKKPENGQPLIIKLKEQFDTLFETVAPKNKKRKKSLEERISCLKKILVRLINI